VIRLPYLATYEPSNPMCMWRARVLPTQAAFRVIYPGANGDAWWNTEQLLLEINRLLWFVYILT